jgi:hypothetical protein
MNICKASCRRILTGRKVNPADETVNYVRLQETIAENLRLACFLALLLAGLSTPGQGIPEPGLIFYGMLNGGASEGQVTWQITNQTDFVSVTSSVVGVTVGGNTQFYYIALIPAETRVAGSQTFPASTNTLGLPQTSTQCMRMATVGGTNAAITYSSLGLGNSFTLVPGSRGLIERVDLSTGISTNLTFAQWLASWGLATNTNPNADPLGKGMTYYQQFIAGTNPTNKYSVFDFTGVVPSPQGLVVYWTSFPNKFYTLESAATLEGDYTILQQNVPAVPGTMPGTNSFTDTTAATLQGPRFYRVLVQQP